MENGSEKISPPVAVKPPEKSLDERIEARFKEYRSNRIVEYLTGLKMDDPELINRLEEDQKVIRAKYGLPDREYKFHNASDYERYLRKLAKTNGVEIRELSDCGKFMEKNQIAGGVYLSENMVIGTTIDRTSEETYLRSLSTLEHETIHSLQHKFYPRMEIEQQEYEAYLANWNIEFLKDNDQALEIVFDYGICNSINWGYKSESEKKGIELKAKWDSPEYFLKNIDKINDEQIQSYKSKQEVVDTQK